MGSIPAYRSRHPNTTLSSSCCTKARDLRGEFAEKHLKRFVLQDDVSSYGFALPGEQINMEVLAFSFDDLNAALVEGMPESITSQVPLWRQ